MDWLATILTSSNATIVLAFVLVLVIISIILVKLGVVSFNSKSLHIGVEHTVRGVILSQMDWIEADVESMYRLIMSDPKSKGLDSYKCKYFCEKFLDRYYRLIACNNISTDHDYIILKQGELWRVVSELLPEKEFNWLEDFIKKRVETQIVELVKIREIHSAIY